MGVVVTSASEHAREPWWWAGALGNSASEFMGDMWNGTPMWAKEIEDREGKKYATLGRPHTSGASSLNPHFN